MTNPARTERQGAVNELKRSLIIDAARRVFEKSGLEDASMRAIAKEAGYTSGAIYFHFPGKEAIYAEVLRELLDRLVASVQRAIPTKGQPEEHLRAGALAFFDFFANDPRDLEFGFYLLGGGLRPRGLSKELNAELNQRLDASLAPIADAARMLGADEQASRAIVADAFGHATGLLLLKHTRRIRMFGCDPRALMERYIQAAITNLPV